jgi:predicted PurR-regulated permease PerM
MKNLVKVAAIICGTALGLLIVWRFRGEFLLFILAVILASILAPFSERLYRRGISYTLSVIGVYAAVIVGFGILLIALAAPLYHDFSAFFTDCGQFYRYITENWPEGNQLQRFIAQHLSPSSQLPEKLASSTDVTLMMQVLGIGGNLLDLLLRMVLIFVIAIYWKLDYLRLERLWMLFIPIQHRKRVRYAWDEAQAAAGDYLRCKLLESLLVGFLFGIAAYWSHFPYPVATALSIAVLLLIPWLGPPLGVAVIWVASYMNFMDVTPLAGLIRSFIASFFACFLILMLKMLVEPRLIEKKRYNSLLVLIVTLAMLYMMGFVAIILGPPVTVAIQIVSGQFISYNASRSRDSEVANLSNLEQSWNERVFSKEDYSSAHTPIFLDIVGRWNALLKDAVELFENAEN